MNFDASAAWGVRDELIRAKEDNTLYAPCALTSVDTPAAQRGLGFDEA